MNTLIQNIKNAQDDYFIGSKLRQELKEVASSLYYKKPESPLINLICSFCEFKMNELKDLSLNCKSISSKEEKSLILALS